MSAAQMPPAEPPADDVAEVLEQLRRARIDRADADHTLGHLLDALVHQEGMTAGARNHLTIERIVAEHRLFLWGQTVSVLEACARNMGLEP